MSRQPIPPHVEAALAQESQPRGWSRITRIPMWRLPLRAMNIPPHVFDALAEERFARAFPNATRPAPSAAQVPAHLLAPWRELIPWDEERETPMEDSPPGHDASREESPARGWLSEDDGTWDPRLTVACPGPGTTRVLPLPDYSPPIENRPPLPPEEMQSLQEDLLVNLQRQEECLRHAARSGSQDWCVMVNQHCQRLVQKALEGRPPSPERELPQ